MKASTLIAIVFSVVLTVVTLGGVVPRLLSVRSDIAFAAANGIIVLFVIIGILVAVKLFNILSKEF